MKRTLATLAVLGLIAGISNAQTLSGSWPEGGGAISVTASGGDVAAAGLDFTSASGSLVPAPGTDASPFTFFLANTANQVTYGNLGTSVTFADGSTTALSVGAVGGATDIVAAWGDGPTPVDFAVSEASPPITGPSITWSPAIATGTTVGDLITGSETITFVAAEYPGSTSGPGGFFTNDGGDTGNPGLNGVLDSHGWNGDGATILIENLTAGNDYQLQLLMGDTRSCCLDRTQTASDGLNVSEEFSRNGGSVVGAFTSTGSSLSVTIAGANDPGLSGYILLDNTANSVQAINFTTGPAGQVVPEPATAPLCLAAFIGIMALRRRR